MTARKKFLLFGNSGTLTNFGQFGSGVTGTPVNTKDIDTIQALTAWLNGLQDSVYGADKLPFLEELNSLLFVMAYQLFYVLERGIPEWDASTTYVIGSVVQLANSGQIYVSKTNGNLNNALPASGTENTNWSYGPLTLASNILGQIGPLQISAVLASTISGMLADAQIAGMSSSKLIGQIIDAQIQAMAASKLTGQVVNAQIQSIDISKVTGPITVSDAAITRVKLDTATGYVSGPGGLTVDLTMQDYTFFPSILTHLGRDSLQSFPSTYLSDTVGRFSKGSSQAYDISWRYVTSSDNPRIWAIVDKAGKIEHAWEAEDPPNHEGVDEGDDEICPFTQTEEMNNAGLSIVNIPIPDATDVHNLISKLDDFSGSNAALRYHKKIRSKEWISHHTIESMRHPLEIVEAVPKEKGPMARQWLFRSVAGRSNIARFIREISTYSYADKRMVFKKDAAAAIGPKGFQPKDSK